MNQDEPNQSTFKNDLAHNWRDAKRYVISLWDTNHTAPWAIGPPTRMEVEKLAVKKRFGPASRYQRIAARIASATMPAMKSKDVEQQREALGTWEDEGGKAVTSAAAKRSH